jgi:hypothetical protein
MDVLNEWDPFKLSIVIRHEIADTIKRFMVEQLETLAKRIQSIYEFSFESTIPMEQCLKIAMN